MSPFLDFFFFTKAKFTSKKLVLNEYEICLKILEMAILEIQIFKTFWKACPQTPGKACAVGARNASHPPPPPPFESPGSAPAKRILVLKQGTLLKYLTAKLQTQSVINNKNIFHFVSSIYLHIGGTNSQEK